MKNKKIFILTSVYVLSIIVIIFVFYNIQSKGSPNVFVNTINSVLELECYNEEGLSCYGTAVCIDNRGYYITNAHVVMYTENNIKKTFNNFNLRFTNEDSYFSVDLVDIDEKYDLALLKSNENIEYKPISFADISKIKTGDNVYVCGNSQNQGISISKGLISKSRVIIEVSNKKYEMIATDAYFSEGASGGALINEKSELIGITTFRLKDSLGNIIYGMGYAIPIDIIETYIRLHID